MRHHRTQHAGIRLMAHAPSATPSGHTATCDCKKVPGRQSAGLQFGIPFDASSTALTAVSIDIGAGNMLETTLLATARHFGAALSHVTAFSPAGQKTATRIA